MIPNRDLHKFNEEIKSIYKKYDYDHSQEAKQILQKILGEDYDEEPMQKIINYVIRGVGPESAEDIIRGFGSIGNPTYDKFGITDVDKIKRIRKKLRTEITALSGGARKRRTRATTVKQRKSSRRQLSLRRRRTNKK